MLCPPGIVVPPAQEARLAPFSTARSAAGHLGAVRHHDRDMSRSALPLGPAPFPVRDAVAVGVPRHRLRRGDLSTPIHGVRASARLQPTLVEAVATVLRDDQWFSHTTAAQIWGGPLPRDLPTDVVHVSTASDRTMRRAHVIGHRCSHPDVVELAVGRVSAPARTWFESAGSLSERDLVALGDYFVGQSGLATVDELAAEIRPGARDARRARAAIARVRVGAESAMETFVRLAVVDAGFPEPELNVEVHDEHGVFLGRVDFAWSDHRIALEYDGDHHRAREQFRRDQRRANGFTTNGWLVIHATAADAARPSVLFERLRQAFVARAGRTRRGRDGERAGSVGRGLRA